VLGKAGTKLPSPRPQLASYSTQDALTTTSLLSACTTVCAHAVALARSLGLGEPRLRDASDHEPYREAAALGLFVTAPYAIFTWRSAAKSAARPYMIASGVYLRMLFILLPIRPRYFWPFCLVVGWSWRCSGGRLCAPCGAGGPVLPSPCRPRSCSPAPLPRSDRRSPLRLGQGEPSGHPPLFRFTSAACQRLSARRTSIISNSFLSLAKVTSPQVETSPLAPSQVAVSSAQPCTGEARVRPPDGCLVDGMTYRRPLLCAVLFQI
jgi:hypothetical protein